MCVYVCVCIILAGYLKKMMNLTMNWFSMQKKGTETISS